MIGGQRRRAEAPATWSTCRERKEGREEGTKGGGRMACNLIYRTTCGGKRRKQEVEKFFYLRGEGGKKAAFGRGEGGGIMVGEWKGRKK